jgi:hypothetical protein
MLAARLPYLVTSLNASPLCANTLSPATPTTHTRVAAVGAPYIESQDLKSRRQKATLGDTGEHMLV